jgi:hypothetical protein
VTSDLVWVLIRQDEGENRYRVGRFATREEAEKVADALCACVGGAAEKVYVIERMTARPAQA